MVSLLALLALLAACTGYQPAAPQSLTFGPGDGRALVLVGISPGQRDGTLRFTRLVDGRDRLVQRGVGDGPVEFTVSNDDRATAFLVTPGRYIVSEASIVTHRGSAFRSGYRFGPGWYPGFYGGIHGPYWHHGWYHEPPQRAVTVTQGERFVVRNGPGGIENRSWIITIPAGRVTALGHFAFEWTKTSNVLNIAQTAFNRATIARALAGYGGVTAPVIDAQWRLYGPDLPPPPMMHWSREF